MRKIIFTLAASVIAVVALPATANASGDGNGNTFNVRESSVNVVGNRCAYIHYSIDGWSAGWDADNTLGTAYAAVAAGNSVWDIESYDWWDWSQMDWDNLTWSGERRICTKADTTLTVRGEFDVFPDDWNDYGYSTVVKDTVRVNYHPVSLTASKQGKSLTVRVRKDGSAWKRTRVNVAGLTAKTNVRGVVKFAKRDLPKGQVKVSVGASPAFATLKVRV